MAKQNAQLSFLKKEPSSFGGELFKTRKGRTRPRPLAVRDSMHLVLRSSKAKGEWSFRKPENSEKIKSRVDRFSKKYGVRILSLANVGNHLHFHIQLTNRHSYRAFIRGLTASIAMAISGLSRWKKKEKPSDRFWDYRPFTRIVQSWRGFLNLRDYIKINQLEGIGVDRSEARFLLACWKIRSNSS
jgi:REP element-mobilizing transposase RayT